jgi:hypothetical protein
MRQLDPGTTAWTGDLWAGPPRETGNKPTADAHRASIDDKFHVTQPLRSRLPRLI